MKAHETDRPWEQKQSSTNKSNNKKPPIQLKSIAVNNK